MSPIEVNSYINAAEEVLRNDPEYMRWFDALVEKRKEAYDNYGYCVAGVEGVLFELWNAKIGYILDHKDEIEEKNKL